MTIHTFGAYYGLTCSYFFQPVKAIEDKYKQNGGNYYSNYLAMIGTFFLFLYWPSFNAATGQGAQQERAMINTLLSITTSVISANFIARVFKGGLQSKGKLDVEILLNATLAGGVAMGSAADLIDQPFSAMISGYVVGSASALGYVYLLPYLKEKIYLHDTCGVHNLHGIPGLLGGTISAIVSGKNAFRNYGARYGDYFAEYTDGRTPVQQAGFQMAGLGLSLGLAIVGGLIGGFLASRSWTCPPEELYDDRDNWTDCTFPYHNKNKIKYPYSDNLKSDADKQPEEVEMVRVQAKFVEQNNDPDGMGSPRDDQDSPNK